MKAVKTVTGAPGQRASSGTGMAFWSRATGRTTCGLIAVAAITLVGPAHTFAAPATQNGPEGIVEALGGLGALANQVAAANSELAALHAQLGSKREAVNKSIVDLQRARAAAASAARAVAAAQKAVEWASGQISAAQKAFDSQAALAYTRGSAGGGVASYLSASNPEEFLQRGQALALVSEAQNMSVDSLVRARDEQAERLAAAQEKQDAADAAKAEAERKKSDALNAIAAVRQATAAQAANVKQIEAQRNAAQASLAAYKEAEEPATAVDAASVAPAAPAASASEVAVTDTKAAPVVEAAATTSDPATTETATTEAAATVPAAPATAGASDWVQLLLELINTGSADSGSTGSGSAGSGSLGGESETPVPVDEAQTPPTTDPAAPPTEDAAAEVPPTEQPVTEDPATEEPVVETPDDSEYYEDDPVITDPGSGGGAEAPDVTGSQGVEIVVSRAMSQLGVMYAWGGGDENGPTLGIRDGGTADSYGDYKTVGFDCSGLMVYAFAGVGISLPHYSGYQYTAGRQVPIANVQRGDMIFWGGGGSQHVALYLGDGMMIEAMQSGTPIHVTEVRYGGIQPYAVRLIE